jgi:L-asparaginase
MKILVVAAGGTIGSFAEKHVIDISSDAGEHLFHLYKEATKRDTSIFDICSPFALLSENIVPADWTILASFIRSKCTEEYSGIIILHGTDTLPYTSAAMSFCLSDLNVPIVMVSSNLPLGCNGSNGLNNFIDAVNFIEDTELHGVFVIYQNIVHLGTRLTEALPFTHQFRSQKDAHFGSIIRQKFVYNDMPFGPTVKELSIKTVENNGSCFSDQVMMIRPYPGLNYKMFDFSNIRPKAILHGLYHAGTACMREDKNGWSNSLARFSEHCTDMDIDIYVAPMPASGNTLYASSNEFANCSITQIHDMTIEAAYAKLSLMYGSFANKDTRHRFLNQNVFFEFITE